MLGFYFKTKEVRMKLQKYSTHNAAFRFVLILGLVNLFADMTYEGGGSINGQFLSQLGASAAAVSIIAGAGEFLGYGVRSLSGIIADKLHRVWSITFVGYAINLLAVPAMALAPNWQVAALFIFLERIGRGIRKPTVESMLSYTTKEFGRGWVYSLNNALDETGATIGPLLMALFILNKGTYRTGFALLLVSSGLALIFLIAARIKFPAPEKLEKINHSPTTGTKKFAVSYWIYMVACSFFAAGLFSYELISYHFVKIHLFDQRWIPAFLTLATALGVFTSLLMGKAYDRYGMPVVIIAVTLSSLFAPLALLGEIELILISMALLGLGYATQDTLFNAIIAGLLPEGRRNFAFGLFYAGYGVGWLLGSIVMGLLYEYSSFAVAIYSIAIQLLSVPLFIWGTKKNEHITSI